MFIGDNVFCDVWTGEADGEGIHLMKLFVPKTMECNDVLEGQLAIPPLQLCKLEWVGVTIFFAIQPGSRCVDTEAWGRVGQVASWSEHRWSLYTDCPSVFGNP